MDGVWIDRFFGQSNDKLRNCRGSAILLGIKKICCILINFIFLDLIVEIQKLFQLIIETLATKSTNRWVLIHQEVRSSQQRWSFLGD